MRTFKRAVTVLLAVAMMVTLFSGCKKQETSTNPTATPTVTSAPTATPTPKPTEVKKDTITVWTYPVEAKYKENFAAIQADFVAKNPNIDIKVEELTWADGPKKFDTAINAGDPPDIMFTAPAAKYIDTGLQLPIEDYIDKSILADFSPQALEYMKFNGKQYGLPLYVALHTIAGNKKLLEEAGIDYKKIQQNGWTWSEFKQLAVKGTKKKADGTQQYGFIFATTGSTTVELLEHMLINNGLPYSVKDGKYTYTDPKFLETLKFIRALVDEGIMPKEANQITPAKRMEMLYNETAMLVGKAIPYYEYMVNENNKKVKDGTAPKDQKEIQFVLLPEPHNDNQKAVTWGTSDGYTLFRQKNYKGDEHTKNAAKFLTALTSGKAGISAVVLCLPQVTKSGEAMYKDKYSMTAENKIASDTLYKNLIAPNQGVSVDMAKKAQQIRDEVLMAKYPALLGREVTPDAMAKAVADKAKELFGN